MWKCNVCGEVFEEYCANGEIPICPKCNPGVKRGLQNEILNYIQTIYSGNIITEDRSIIDPLELDIYIPELKLAIEIDGDYWHSENPGVNKFYHLNKTKLCEEKGIKLIHIFEYQWKYKKDQVIDRLNNLFNYFPDDNRIYARKCVIKLVKNSVANEFLDKQHLQGPINSKVNLGLYSNDELIDLMTFGKPRFNKNYEWELLRYCSKGRVIGGASKLLKYFEREYKPNSLISYADRCWTSKLHNVYSSIGFTYIYMTLSLVIFIRNVEVY